MLKEQYEISTSEVYQILENNNIVQLLNIKTNDGFAYM